jgi:hypothetical protein
MPPCPRNSCCTAECLAECFCAIRIDMPLPNDVSQADGPSCPPSDCTITAKCWACYQIMDGIWRLGAATRKYTDPCSSSLYQKDTTGGLGDCDELTLIWGDPDAVGDETPIPCWETNNYDCPDCTSESFLQCGAQYGVKDLILTFEIACVDGCCTVSLEIAYTVFQYCDELVVLPDPDPVSPETRYTHTFSASDLCSCEEVAGAILSFSSTSSTNNSRGVTVPDVCNAASATVSLTGNENCGCICFDCLDFSNDINVALSGGEFTGTVVATYEPYTADPREDRSTCLFTGGATGATCGFTVEVEIECAPCEKYNITVRLRTGDGIDECIATYEKLGVACGALSGFTFVSQTGTCPCDLDDFTISLS